MRPGPIGRGGVVGRSPIPGRMSIASPRGNCPIGIIRKKTTPVPPVVPTGKQYWWHRWNGKTPTFQAESVAVGKGMTIVVTIGNSTYSWCDEYETEALAFQAAHGNCPMVISQSFWSQFASLADAWPSSSTVWDKTYPARRLVDTSTLTVMMDFEPLHYYPLGVHDIPNCLAESCFGVVTGGVYGVAGTAQQISDAQAYLSSHGYLLGTPELRDLTTRVPTVVGSHYNILQSRCTRRFNQATYNPYYTTLDGISSADIIGLRVTVDGRSGSYTPEQAKAKRLEYPTRDFMYFNLESTDSAKVAIVNRL